MGLFKGDQEKTSKKSEQELLAAQKKAASLYPGAQSNVDGGIPIVEVIHTRNDTLFRVKLNPWVEAVLNTDEVIPPSGLHTVGQHIHLASGKKR